MSDAAEARRVDVPLAEPLGKAGRESVERLNRAFSHGDIRVEPNGESLSVFVRQVDIGELEKAALGADGSPDPVLGAVVESVKAIKSYGIRSGKRLYVGFADERKVRDRSRKEDNRGKHYYTRGHGFGREQNELPGEFADAVVCGDSEEVLKRLPGNCVDLVFTSPPYNFGLDYSGAPDDERWALYFGKLFRVFDECIRIVKHGGRIIVNIQPLYSDYIPSHHIVSGHFLKRKLIWKGEVVWEKNNYNCKYTAWGSWKSPSNPYLKYSWEFLEIFCKGDLKKPGDPGKVDIAADEFKKWVYGKWSIAPERRMREFDHPAMFPEALADRVLRLFSFQGDVILDPFAGTGTTCVAAKQTGRRYLGIDIAREYCDVARERLDSCLL